MKELGTSGNGMCVCGEGLLGGDEVKNADERFVNDDGYLAAHS